MFQQLSKDGRLEPTSDEKTVFDGLRHVLLDAAPILDKDRRMTTLNKSKNKSIFNTHIIGSKFNDDVYWSLSQGLLDVRMLELIQNKETFDDIVIAPSYLIKEAWNIP